MIEKKTEHVRRSKVQHTGSSRADGGKCSYQDKGEQNNIVGNAADRLWEPCPGQTTPSASSNSYGTRSPSPPHLPGFPIPQASGPPNCPVDHGKSRKLNPLNRPLNLHLAVITKSAPVKHLEGDSEQRDDKAPVLRIGSLLDFHLWSLFSSLYLSA